MTEINIENYSLSELIPGLVRRFLSFDLSGDLTKNEYIKVHLLAEDCRLLEEQQSEDEVNDWLAVGLLHGETKMFSSDAILDAIAKRYPDLPHFALEHIKTVAEAEHAKQEASQNTAQLASLISFHLRSVLLPLWRKEELEAQFDMLRNIKKPTPTLEELAEQVKSLSQGLKKIQRFGNAGGFYEGTEDLFGDINEDDSNDGLAF